MIFVRLINKAIILRSSLSYSFYVSDSCIHSGSSLICYSLNLCHKHTQILSLSLSNTHIHTHHLYHTLSLSLSLSYSDSVKLYAYLTFISNSLSRLAHNYLHFAFWDSLQINNYKNKELLWTPLMYNSIRSKSLQCFSKIRCPFMVHRIS